MQFVSQGNVHPDEGTMQSRGNLQTSQSDNRHAAIAPAPGAAPSNLTMQNNSLEPTMPYTCQSCVKRKLKCDKLLPKCTRCRRGQVECSYQAPPPRQRRKRRLSSDIVDAKLAQYERTLNRYERILNEHGLLPPHNEVIAEAALSNDERAAVSTTRTENPAISLGFNEPDTDKSGKLVAKQGKSLYINSNLWHNFGEELSDGEDDGEGDDDQMIEDGIDGSITDPLSGALIAPRKRLLSFHPTHQEALALWRTHVDRVEPLCKVLHIPSMARMVDAASLQPGIASKADECLLFAIYHFAVFSMTDNECMTSFRQPRAALLQKYRLATEHALVNASWLKTTEIKILQGFVLLLVACRASYDPQTYWILTGVAVRIAQRMGLHRNDEKLGLPPFEVQMRRRLFYQIIPLDGISGQVSGTGISIVHDNWDAQAPLNINDDQIWPGMTQSPQVQNGATEMIFCLTRATLGSFFSKVGNMRNFKDFKEAETVISEAEREVEEKYIRYCDVINPLHFLAVCFARSAIMASRQRSRLPRLKSDTATDVERKEAFQLSMKILETDCVAFANAGLQKYLWHINSFFAWGTWDSLVVVMTTLQKRPDLLSTEEINDAWSRLGEVRTNHSEAMNSKRPLYMTLSRLTLKAWDATHPAKGGQDVSEPEFIAILRSARKASASDPASRQDRNSSTTTTNEEGRSEIISASISPSSGSDETNALFDSLVNGMMFDVSNDYMNLGDTENWTFLNQSTQNYY